MTTFSRGAAGRAGPERHDGHRITTSRAGSAGRAGPERRDGHRITTSRAGSAGRAGPRGSVAWVVDGAGGLQVDGVAGRQLDAIREVVALAERLRAGVWLRGGWGMDFFLGEVTRSHVDVDWFCWSEDGPLLVAALVARGWRLLPEPPHDRQMDLIKGDVEQSLTLVGRDETGRPVVPAGPWAGAP
ncbi:nucleotidyltransferase domain-containing protein [Actinoplanes sp. NPDC020271]|uniref:nucleotidyltransferase domain-containing protein n=1 Tax=Actinoplanes sp. NPDC020271 TaxID=3363896 RepID=UPI0037988132